QHRKLVFVMTGFIELLEAVLLHLPAVAGLYKWQVCEAFIVIAPACLQVKLLAVMQRAQFHLGGAVLEVGTAICKNIQGAGTLPWWFAAFAIDMYGNTQRYGIDGEGEMALLAEVYPAQGHQQQAESDHDNACY